MNLTFDPLPPPLEHYLKNHGIGWMASAALPYEERQAGAEDLERDLREQLAQVSAEINRGADGAYYHRLRDRERELLAILEPAL